MNGERAILFATDPPYLVDYDGSNHPTRNKDWSPSYGVTWDDSSQGDELYELYPELDSERARTEADLRGSLKNDSLTEDEKKILFGKRD